MSSAKMAASVSQVRLSQRDVDYLYRVLIELLGHWTFKKLFGGGRFGRLNPGRRDFRSPWTIQSHGSLDWDFLSSWNLSFIPFPRTPSSWRRTVTSALFKQAVTLRRRWMCWAMWSSPRENSTAPLAVWCGFRDSAFFGTQRSDSGDDGRDKRCHCFTQQPVWHRRSDFPQTVKWRRFCGNKKAGQH